jgi:hypothetical protein
MPLKLPRRFKKLGFALYTPVAIAMLSAFSQPAVAQFDFFNAKNESFFEIGIDGKTEKKSSIPKSTAAN